jgi:membrane protein DedA with SNARE-associated domain/rhodanese-related sulfurtransferase
MPDMVQLLQQYGVAIVFATVLLEQIGLPIPAFPVLIVAGALAVDGQTSWPACLAASLAACLISDYFWFRAGRHYGKRILRFLCKVSLSPDYCVSQTEDNFKRWGAKSLIVAKFIPGFNTIAPPLAGALGTGGAKFLGYSVLGGLLWGGSGLLVGGLFHTRIDQVLAALATMGSTAVLVVASLLAVFVLFKYVERRRFQRAMMIPRISIDELKELIAQGHEPVIVDARSATAQLLEPPVPGALIFNDAALAERLAALDKDRHIIVYCSCPNDVTAAQVAKQLHGRGFHRAKPLSGGLDAWNAAGVVRP